MVRRTRRKGLSFHNECIFEVKKDVEMVVMVAAQSLLLFCVIVNHLNPYHHSRYLILIVPVSFVVSKADEDEKRSLP